MAELVAAGMDVARLNMRHGDRDFHRRAYRERALEGEER
jgi:pyruvate kinase